MPIVITDRKDPKYDAIMSYLFGAAPVITTGVHATEGAPTYADGPSIAQIAEAAEFGLGQPMRSWLRAWFDENQEEIARTIVEQFTLALAAGESQDWAANRVALWMQASIQDRISSGIDPENAPITIALKGSSTPLIDTGLFRSAIVSYVNGGAV